MIEGGFSPLQSPGDTPLILGPHPKSAPSPPQDSPGPCLFSLGLGGKIINLRDKRRDKDHLLKTVSSVMCWREHIQDFPKAACSATHPQFPVMVSSPPRKKCAPPHPISSFQGLKLPGPFVSALPICILRKPSGSLLFYLGRVSGWRCPIPHPSLLTLMITFLKEPGGEIPKLLVAEFQVEDEQINNGLPN